MNKIEISRYLFIEINEREREGERERDFIKCSMVFKRDLFFVI